MSAPVSPATVGQTPRSWHVDGPHTIRDEKGQRIADLWMPANLPGVRKANAQLIAAAPDLLAQRDAAVAALRDLRAHHHRALVSTGTDPEYADAACEAADAAIALADHNHIGGHHG